jgi:hypothetical protein
VAESGGDFLATVRTTKIGPTLVFDRLWLKRGVDAVLGELWQALVSTPGLVERRRIRLVRLHGFVVHPCRRGGGGLLGW